MDEEISPKLPKIKNTGSIIASVIITIVLLIILRHNLAFQKKSTIVLPAGGTYLGPKDTPTEPPPSPPAGEPQPTAKNQPAAGAGKFTVAKDATWVTVNGNVYPYSFKSPSTLKLVTFPGENKYDIYAISWNNQPADQNVLIGVDNLNNSENSKQYITVSKRTYVENWWKQFGGLKGVSSITEFTNSQGLKGYKAKYLDNKGIAPNIDVFFEVPDPQYVIHLASGVLAPEAFDPLIDSITWTKK